MNQPYQASLGISPPHFDSHGSQFIFNKRPGFKFLPPQLRMRMNLPPKFDLSQSVLLGEFSYFLHIIHTHFLFYAAFFSSSVRIKPS